MHTAINPSIYSYLPLGAYSASKYLTTNRHQARQKS